MANGYRGTIPEIAKAFQNDPRTQLAQAALANGVSSAPVAAGGWGVTDGLARAAQALVGAYGQKRQEQKYAAREANYVAGVKNAAALAAGGPGVTPAPAPAPTGLNAAASAMAPAGAPAAPTGGNPGFVAPAPLPSVGSAPAAPAVDPSMGGSMVPPGAPPGAMPKPDAAVGYAGSAPSIDYYRSGIRPIEGGTDPKTGAFRTSPKGAVGPGQLMPSTGPEAARLAGLPWDENRFRSDAKYNDALGNAYYNKQLNDFGDPVHAAAAYNAGPGATRRALRRANAAGDADNFQNYFPAGNTETPKYVADFKARVGKLTPGAQAGITPPSMEAVPDALAMPTDKPAMPNAPDPLRSKRIAIANQLLSSNDPDMVTLAQSYLDKGLDEDHDADKVHNAQEFDLYKMGYQSDLGDYTDARSQARSSQVADRNSAQQRNFSREQTATSQAFTAGQAQTDRNFQAGQAAIQRAFQDSQRRKTEAFTASESEKDRDTKEQVAAAKQQTRNAFLTSPTGLKMQKDLGDTIQNNADSIVKLERFKDLNSRQSTGGRFGIPGYAGVAGIFDKDLSEMTSIANDSTLAKLGGSLGVAISDGDRKFIGESNISTSKPREANENIANALIGVLKRKSDYAASFAAAQADGNGAKFIKDWSQFAKAVPVVTYSRDGTKRATAEPMTFDQWQSRTRIDANGKVVK